MININDYIGKHFVGKKIHFVCDCVINMDITGECITYNVKNNEIILIVKTEKHLIPIGLNTPNLKINIL